MRTAVTCCAVLLIAAPSYAQIGNTSCTKDIFGDWNCTGSRGSFLLQKDRFEPKTWQIRAVPGTGARNCTIRQDLLGTIQSTCY